MTAKKHRFPTVRQLEDGVVIDCAKSRDEALEQLEASHLRLLLSEDVSEDDDDPDELDQETGIELHVRYPGDRRFKMAGVFPFFVDTPWDDDEEELLLDYLARLVDARDLVDELDFEEEEEDDEEWDEDEEWDDDEDDGPASPEGSQGGSSFVDSENVRHVSGKAELSRLVLKSELPVIVDFTAEWCGPCQELRPHLSKLADEMEDELRVVKVDVDDNEDLAESWDVEAVPTVLFFAAGEKKGVMEGFTGPSRLKKFVKKHLEAVR